MKYLIPIVLLTGFVWLAVASQDHARRKEHGYAPKEQSALESLLDSEAGPLMAQVFMADDGEPVLYPMKRGYFRKGM